MTEHCSNCLSIRACVTHTPHSLRLSGSFHFNEELLDQAPCTVTVANDDNVPFQSVLQLPYTEAIDDGINLFNNSIYIRCHLCESMYTLTYYLASKYVHSYTYIAHNFYYLYVVMVCTYVTIYVRMYFYVANTLTIYTI